MANRKISDLAALTAPATGDLLPIVDISEAAAADKNKKITFGELLSSAPAGSAAAPSFSFDGDPNTGIFNPAADTLAFAEGGSEVMRIDSSGRLGIGTSSPLTPLAVSGGVTGGNTVTQNSEIAFPSAANNGYLRLVGGYQVGTGTGGTIQLGGRSFSDSGNVGAFLISANTNAGFNTTDLTVSTQTSFNNVVSEKLRIDQFGRVGIGTSAPNAPLNVAADNVAFRGQLSLQTLNANSYGQITFYDRTTLGAQIVQSYTSGIYDLAIQNVLNGSLTFSTNNTEKLRITAGGNVGIGTTSPSNVLHVVSASAGASSARFSDGINSTLIIGHAATNLAYLDAYTNLGFYISGSEKARIDSSGRLLVGTSSDSGGALFQVNGDRIRVGTAKTPATSGATGTTGEIAWDANYIYVCTATNTWKRSAIATW